MVVDSDESTLDRPVQDTEVNWEALWQAYTKHVALENQPADSPS